MSKILVTGATGFAGSYLVRALLRQGEKVRCLTRPGANLYHLADIADQLEWMDGDILDIFSVEEALQEVEQVYHFAGLVSYNRKDRDLLMKVNEEGTANVVNACLQKPGIRLLHVSSIAAIGKKYTAGETVDESKGWENNRAVSDYALSKFRAEQEVWRGIAEGLDAVIINPSVILGAGEWSKGSAALFHTVAKGYPFYTQGVTGYVDVRDVADVAITLMKSDIHGERFIVNAENRSFQSIFTTMATSLEVKPPTMEAKKWMGSIAWRAGALVQFFTGKKPAVTRTTARMAYRKTNYNSDKLIGQIGFTFRPIDQTIEESAQSYRQTRQDQKHHPLSF